jgi:hypothetical protein
MSKSILNRQEFVRTVHLQIFSHNGINDLYNFIICKPSNDKQFGQRPEDMSCAPRQLFDQLLFPPLSRELDVREVRGEKRGETTVVTALSRIERLLNWNLWL